MLKSLLISYLVASSRAYSVGDVNPRALQGIWRLTSLDKDGLPFEKHRNHLLSADPESIWESRGFMPMKEFTTYPKKKLSLPPPEKKQTELYIKLKDDMTFEQCSSSLYEDDEEKSLEEKLQADLARRERETFAMKGTWDFIDGKLILASDRPEKKPFSAYDDEELPSADTILVGKVSASSEESFESPVVEDAQMTKEPKHDAKQKQIDVNLSVPKGKIKTGKFMYPKHHPSFFEQPIFNPQSTGRFELKQVESDHKVEDEDDLVEIFRKDDLAGKKYYLSTFPLAERKKKDRRGRVIEEEGDETEKLAKNVQVVGIELFANNTFTTLSGLGYASSSEVRRGKWSIVGEKRDQVWIQVYRFGFGRSVSYGTYSEGRSLTQDDEKAYWGKITEVGTDNDNSKTVEIDGAIMLGTGLEPCSIGRFRMVEMNEQLNTEESRVDEGRYVRMIPDDIAMNAKRFEMMFSDTENGSEQSSFDPSGAFE